MRKIKETRKDGGTGRCVLWQEDVKLLLELVKQHSKDGPSITTGRYEFESAEELFKTFGPRLPELRINGRNADIFIHLSHNWSRFTVETGFSPEPIPLEQIHSELAEFFRERRSLRPLLEILLPLSLVALFSALIFRLLQFAPASWFVKVAGLLAGLVFIACLVLGLNVFVMGTRDMVLLRNRSRVETLFKQDDQRKKNLDRLVFTAIGAVFSFFVLIIVQWLK